MSFWIAQMVFFAYIGFRTHQLTSSSGPLWLISSQRTLPLVAQSAAAQFETGGVSALKQELARRTDNSRIRMWLTDSEGRDLAGGTLPQPAEEAVHNARSDGDTYVRTGEQSTYVSTRVTGQRGNYTLVARYDTVPLLRGQGLFRLFAISTILASIACLLLAHYMSKPIWQLRLATQRLATGNLDARVGEKLGTRSDEIGDLVRDFDSMAERIRELLENQKRLLSDVSHELRSPLARLRVALALARRREDQSQRASHERIETEVERLDEMIGRILMLSRLEAGEDKLRTTDVDLNELIESVLADARFEAERTGHSFDFESDAHLHLPANEELLRSSIENVVRNAMYYTSGDDPIHITLSSDGNRAILRVRDNGPGVPPEALPNLFRAFYRVDDSRVSQTGGTGLGLAIAQRAIIAHGGTITARNVEPHGLEIEITIPASVVATPVLRA